MNSAKTPGVADYFSELKVPDVNDMALNLEQLVLQGTLSPEEAQTIMLEQSAMNNIESDPALKEAQMNALSELQNISKSGGLTAQDRARLGRIKSEEDTANRGKREAILQNMQARGIGGSGIGLAAQLQNQQDSAMRQSQRDMDVAALAEQRALDALMQQGQLAGNIRGQNFGEASQIAQANDAIAQFNAQNRQNQINRNVDMRNQAAAQNLGMKQDIANQNVGLRNTQQQYNKELQQQNFQNQMAKRGAQAGLAQTNAQIAGQNAANKVAQQNQMLGIGAGLASGGLGYAATKYAADKRYGNNQYNMGGIVGYEHGGMVDGLPTEGDSVTAMLTPGEIVIRKEDVPEMMRKAHTDEKGEFDVAGFLDTVTGHKYGYRKGMK